MGKKQLKLFSLTCSSTKVRRNLAREVDKKRRKFTRIKINLSPHTSHFETCSNFKTRLHSFVEVTLKQNVMVQAVENGGDITLILCNFLNFAWVEAWYKVLFSSKVSKRQ